MKKILVVGMLAAVSLQCSTEEPDTLVLNPSEITLAKGETHQISVSSKSELTYATENDFHAEVDPGGLVTANYVGETLISVSNTGDSKSLKVTVAPQNKLYPDPVLEYKKTKSEIRAKYGTPIGETNEALAYTNYSANAPGLLFLFDSNGLCTGITILVKIAVVNQLADFIQERYFRISSQDLYFADSFDPDKAKSFVLVDTYNASYYSVIYMDASYTGARKKYRAGEIPQLAALRQAEGAW